MRVGRPGQQRIASVSRTAAISRLRLVVKDATASCAAHPPGIAAAASRAGHDLFRASSEHPGTPEPSSGPTPWFRHSRTSLPASSGATPSRPLAAHAAANREPRMAGPAEGIVGCGPRSAADGLSRPGRRRRGRGPRTAAAGAGRRRESAGERRPGWARGCCGTRAVKEAGGGLGVRRRALRFAAGRCGRAGPAIRASASRPRGCAGPGRACLTGASGGRLFDRCFWLGDFNYRVDMSRDEVDRCDSAPGAAASRRFISR